MPTPIAARLDRRDGRRPEDLSTARRPPSRPRRWPTSSPTRASSPGLTGEPLTEATILGIGGGLGAGYILWEFKSHGAPVLTVAFRNQWQYPWIPGWTGKTLERLGIEADVNQTGGAKGAREALDARLDAGSPVIASVDLAMIETWGLPGRFRATSNTFVICGREADGTYLVDDRGRAPFRIAPDVLAAARGGSDRSSTGSFGKSDRGPAPRGSASCGAAGRPRGSGRPPALEIRFVLIARLAQMGADDDRRTQRQGVAARVCRRSRPVRALLAIVEAVDASASPWGSHLRDLYATSLDETAVALDRPALAEAARAWREAADAWEELADSGSSVGSRWRRRRGEAAETVRSAVNEGEAGRAQVQAAAAGTWGNRARYARSFPLPADGIDEILRSLGDQLYGIHQEVDAVEATARAIGR